MQPDKDLVSSVVAFFGSQVALARGIGVTQQAVSYWLKSGQIPPTHCAKVEVLSNGRFTRKELCPNGWQSIWPELAATHEQTQAPALDRQAVGAMAASIGG